MSIAKNLADKTKIIQNIKRSQEENVQHMKDLYKRVLNSNNILLGGAKQKLENMLNNRSEEKSQAINNILNYLNNQKKLTNDKHLNNRIDFAKKNILNKYKNML